MNPPGDWNHRKAVVEPDPARGAFVARIDAGGRPFSFAEFQDFDSALAWARSQAPEVHARRGLHEELAAV